MEDLKQKNEQAVLGVANGANVNGVAHSVINDDKGHQNAQPKSVTVTVNEKPVTFPDHKATGAQIKAAAIGQGLPIEPDFTLYEVKGNSGQGGNKQRKVSDDEVVTLHPDQAFRAVTPDDQS